MGLLDMIFVLMAAAWGAVIGSLARSRGRSYGLWLVVALVAAFFGLSLSFDAMLSVFGLGASPTISRNEKMLVALALWLGPLVAVFLPRPEWARPLPPPPVTQLGPRDRTGRVSLTLAQVEAVLAGSSESYSSTIEGLAVPGPDGTHRGDVIADVPLGRRLDLVAEPDGRVAVMSDGRHLGHVPVRLIAVREALARGDRVVAVLTAVELRANFAERAEIEVIVTRAPR